MHTPRKLRAADMGLAELAIYWLWTGLRKDEGLERVATSPSSGPIITPALLARHKTGPPEAPYPMSESTFPAFVGPRTCILNTGAVLNGWVLQIPRYLSEGEILVASGRLQVITNRVSRWSLRVDPSCTLGVKRSMDEDSALMDYLKQQSNKMTLLKDVIGLDFGAQGNQHEMSTPIWVQKFTMNMSLETPKKPTMLPTPPSTKEKQQPAGPLFRVSDAPSPSSRGLTMRNGVIWHANMATTAPNANDTLRPAENIMTRSREAAVSLTTPVSNGQDDLLQLPAPEIHKIVRNITRLDRGDVRGDAQADKVVSNTSRVRPFTARQIDYSKSIVVGFKIKPASICLICDVILIIVSSSILCSLLIWDSTWLQEYIVWPSDVAAWLAEIPERRNAIIIFAVLVGPFVGLLLGTIPNLTRNLAWGLAGIVGLFMAALVSSIHMEP
ncbi:hypothetical protein DE146DRAFT_664104 [Phaeosphaeria sp. MPI-PUGE-AT-0046c]|nr:hypothetical protein DE146DRAFT_664104 [Phaeosphaeria sp. MPI-PUGE-AT-0046c]